MDKKLNINRLALFAFGSTFLLLLIFALFFLPVALNGRTLPSTYALNTEISLMTQAKAEEEIKKKIYPFLSSEILIQFEKVDYAFTLKELGVDVDLTKFNQELPLINKNEPFAILFLKSLHTKQIELNPKIDRTKLNKAILDKIGSIKKPANAYYEILDNELLIKEEKKGDHLDLQKLTDDFKKNINSLSLRRIVLKNSQISPLINSVLLSSFKNSLLAKMGAKIVLSYNNKKWEIVPFSHKDLFKIEIQPTFLWKNFNIEIPLELKKDDDLFGSFFDELPLSYQPYIRIQSEQFDNYTEKELKKSIEVSTSDVKIFYNDKGVIEFSGTATDGITIKRNQLVKSLELAVNKNISNVKIPNKILKASVTPDDQVEALGIKNLIAVGYSNFSGSTSKRIHNISTAIRRFNGLLVAPDEIFSFNANLGKVDGSTGYLKELVIAQNKTTPEYGGGVCQVSSTIYRAAFFGGLPIVTRKAHSFAVSYYAKPLGYGLDATIYVGGQDFKFKNDTSAHILIQVYIDGSDLYFKFYGTDDDREVLTEGPFISNKKAPPPLAIEYTDELAPRTKKKTENAISGFDAVWYRTIIKGGQTIKETFDSHYRPWGEKILIGNEKPAEPVTPPSTPVKP